MPASDVPRIGVVVLTMGTRPAELRAGLESVLSQQGVSVDVACVGNGWQPVDLPEGVTAVALPENRGIPAGRNAGVPHVAGDLLFFLDDDAMLPDPSTLRTMADRFARHPHLGLIQPRVDPLGPGEAPGRWVPRWRYAHAAEPGFATSLWEGAVMIRRHVFERAGGWPEPFFYAHEGIELCWRTWDTGHTCWYAGDIPVLHPVIDPARHSYYWRLNARNRVWLARRNLPLVLMPFYTASWALLAARRIRGRDERRAWWNGFVEGWRTDPGMRRPLRWRTVVALSRAGRPPIL